MKKLIIKTALFLIIPIVLLSAMELILPPTFFSHRSWEGLSYQSIQTESYMYRNIVSSTIAYGDLCHHTEFALPKYEYWKTDNLGYRNEEYVEQADVLLVGDSFFAGCGLSQAETIAYQLKYKFNNRLSVYTISTATFPDFVRILKSGIIKPPKVLIYECVERNTPLPIYFVDRSKDPTIGAALRKLFGNLDMDVYYDRATRFLFLKWLTSRLNGAHGVGIQSRINPKMFFLEGTYKNQVSSADIDKEARIIYSYKQFCDSIGSGFIYMPMPNKETVYYDLIPSAKQPDRLLRLDSALHTFNVNTVSPLIVFNNYRHSNSEFIYHYDDSHWNARGVSLIAAETFKSLRSLPVIENLLRK